MPPSEWLDLGPAEQFTQRPVTEVTLGHTKLAVTHRDGIFGVISGVCNHVGGPLGQGRLEGDYVFVRGTTGNFIVVPDSANRGLRRTPCRATS